MQGKFTRNLLFCAVVFLASACFAQKVPVSLQGFEELNKDETCVKFSQSLADEVQLSGKFYMWTGDYADFPLNGVRITVWSVRVTQNDNKKYLGSAIFVQADRQSAKDAGYYKRVRSDIFMVPRDYSVTDYVRGFLAEVDRLLEH